MTPGAAAEAVDADMLVKQVQQAVRIPSVTPHEADFAHWVYGQLQDGAWDFARLSPCDENRPNVYAGIGHKR